MNDVRFRTASVLCVLGLVIVASTVAIRAYNTFGSWGTSSVVMYVNPQNADVSASAAEAALLVGMDVWNSQGNANVKFVYGGRVSDTTIANEGRNVVIFRNATDGASIATTYSWSVGGKIVNADVVFWDQPYAFFTGTSGCSGGAYIEDISSHELGHALGLLHSSDPSATMVSGYPYCSQELRTLSSDDIAGVQSLYGKATGKPTNTAPLVTIAAPGNGLPCPWGRR